MNIPYIKSNKNGWLEISGTGDFSVMKTFDCGQCFRFNPVSDTRFPVRVDGVALGKELSLAQKNDGSLFIKSTEKDLYTKWIKYLALDADYNEYNKCITSSLSGADAEHMKRAVEASQGIRILRQDPWEALCSFIVSQNNNIPRIKKIIAAMCEAYGEKTGDSYTFPAPDSLVKAGEEGIFKLKTGFRAKYIYDAARKISLGEVSLDSIMNAATYVEAEGQLMTISGVGRKVAACALLFGFERTEAFPIDVWIKRVIATRFPTGLDPSSFGKYAGIAQQYLFYYERYCRNQPDQNNITV